MSAVTVLLVASVTTSAAMAWAGAGAVVPSGGSFGTLAPNYI